MITFGDEVLSDFSDRDHGLDAHSQLALVQRQDVVERDGHFVALVLNTNSRSRVSELDVSAFFLAFWRHAWLTLRKNVVDRLSQLGRAVHISFRFSAGSLFHSPT